MLPCRLVVVPMSVPALTLVPPAYVFAPVSTSVPAPFLTKPPAPLMMPPKALDAPLAPADSVPLPSVMLPVPVRPPTV